MLFKITSILRRACLILENEIFQQEAEDFSFRLKVSACH